MLHDRQVFSDNASGTAGNAVPLSDERLGGNDGGPLRDTWGKTFLRQVLSVPCQCSTQPDSDRGSHLGNSEYC